MIIRMFVEEDEIKHLEEGQEIKCYTTSALLNNPVPIIVDHEDLMFHHYDKETDTVVYDIDHDDVLDVYY